MKNYESCVPFNVDTPGEEFSAQTYGCSCCAETDYISKGTAPDVIRQIIQDAKDKVARYEKMLADLEVGSV